MMHRSIGFAAVLWLASSCGAQNISVWVGADGSYIDPANWQTGAVPTVGGIGVYNGGIVRIGDGYWPVSVVAGTTASLPGVPFTSGDGTIVQSGGRVDFGAVLGAPSLVLLGNAPGTAGRYELRGTGVLTGLAAVAGSSGHGELLMRDRAVLLLDRLVIAGAGNSFGDIGATGEVIIEGSDVFASITGTNGDSIRIGRNGSGVLRVRDGATLFTDEIYLTTCTAAGSLLELRDAVLVLARRRGRCSSMAWPLGSRRCRGLIPRRSGRP